MEEQANQSESAELQKSSDGNGESSSHLNN